MNEFVSLGVALLTVSDSRTEATDQSGATLSELVRSAGHKVVSKSIVPDDVYKIRAALSMWIAAPEVQAIITTGGTGFANRDSTPEAVQPLFDKEVTGFGELFRHLSHDQIGSSTVQSRALAGLANRTILFCLPGSTNACQTAWDGIIREQLDARHSPCNFVPYLLGES